MKCPFHSAGTPSRSVRGSTLSAHRDRSGATINGLPEIGRADIDDSWPWHIARGRRNEERPAGAGVDVVVFSETVVRRQGRLHEVDIFSKQRWKRTKKWGAASFETRAVCVRTIASGMGGRVGKARNVALPSVPPIRIWSLGLSLVHASSSMCRNLVARQVRHSHNSYMQPIKKVEEMVRAMLVYKRLGQHLAEGSSRLW